MADRGARSRSAGSGLVALVVALALTFGGASPAPAQGAGSAGDLPAPALSAPAEPAETTAPQRGAEEAILGEHLAQTSGAPIDRGDKEAVRVAYTTRLGAALAVDAAFSGTVASCTPGVESSASRSAQMQAINFYRAMVGVPEVVNAPEWNAKAQAAALMMDAASRLSHDPDPSWPCYSTAGAEGAANSNLAFSSAVQRYAGARAIAGYMLDPGANNAAVGHRRWLLHPTTTRMGVGTTTRANAVWVVEPGTYHLPAPPGLDWVAWPPDGYVPWEVVPLEDRNRRLFRWSLSSTRADVDVSSATVTMKLGSETLVVTPEVPQSGAIGPTLVWSAHRASGARFAVEGDATVTATVSGLTKGGAPLPPQTRTTRLFRATPDTTPPPPAGFQIPRGRIGSAVARWSYPFDVDGDLAGAEVRVREGTTPLTSRSQGRLGCTATVPAAGTPTAGSCTVTGLTAGRHHAIGVFTRDFSGNYATTTPAVHLSGTSVTASAASTVRIGSSTTITGRTWYGMPESRTVVGSLPLVLESRVRNADGTWTAFATAATRTSAPSGTATVGTYSIGIAPKRTTQYRVNHPGSDWYLGSRSPVVTVTVSPSVTAALSASTIRLGATATLSGAVSPKQAGRSVTLQRRRSDGTWADVTSTKLSSTSTYRFALKPSARGTFTYRVRIGASHLSGAGVSPSRALKVS